MAFDLAAMRGFVRFLVSDPNGDALSNNDVRDFYINPAYQDWWYSFERRPVTLHGTIVHLNGGERFANFGAFDQYAEHVGIYNYTTNVGSVMTRNEFNRIRYLQETEGAVGMPSTWGPWAKSVVGVPNLEVALYPIADTQGYDVFLYGNTHGGPTLLTLDNTACATDPVSARYIARLAAYRLACDMRLPQRAIQAILGGLPGWVRGKLNLDWRLEDKNVPREQVLGWSDPPPGA